MSANVFSARLYQKECSMATARSKVGCTAAAHEVGKETLPSLPPGASSSWARAARDETSRKDAETAKARRLALIWKLSGETDGWARIVFPSKSALCALSSIQHESRDADIRSRDLQIHKRPVLLAAEDVVVVDVARDGRAGDGDLDGGRGVVVDDRDDFRPEAVGAREPLRVDDARVAHLLVGGAVLHDDVEGQLERTGVLAADQLRDLPELHRTVSYSILNISSGEAGSTTWFRLKR